MNPLRVDSSSLGGFAPDQCIVNLIHTKSVKAAVVSLFASKVMAWLCDGTGIPIMSGNDIMIDLTFPSLPT